MFTAPPKINAQTVHVSSEIIWLERDRKKERKKGLTSPKKTTKEYQQQQISKERTVNFSHSESPLPMLHSSESVYTMCL